MQSCLTRVENVQLCTRFPLSFFSIPFRDLPVTPAMQPSHHSRFHAIQPSQPHSKLGPSITTLNLNSPPPASSSLFKKACTPSSRPFSLSTSSPSANTPLFNGPFLLPSNSHKLPSF